MKKHLFVVPLLLIFALPAYAANAQNANSMRQVQEQIRISPSATGVLNQNQVTTRNQGATDSLQVATREEEENAEGSGAGIQNRSRIAAEHMSAVAQRVQELLQVRTIGGIGEEVRQVAQAQNQAQEKIQEHLAGLEQRSALVRALLGPDYGALARLKEQVEQNRLRVQQLEGLKDQLDSWGDRTAVEETIQALTDENASLSDLVAAQEQTKSLFGWLMRLFSK
jgi:hypothetical protein